MATTRPDRLHFTGNDEADELLAREPLALLVAFALDQQVSVQKAFSSPLELKQRLGGRLDAADIAGRDPGELEEIFRTKPALHRYPGMMARRTQELCAAIAITGVTLAIGVVLALLLVVLFLIYYLV